MTNAYGKKIKMITFFVEYADKSRGPETFTRPVIGQD